MKTWKLAASLLALSLLAGPAGAQSTKGAESSEDLATTQQQAAQPSARKLPPQVQAILDQGTDFSGMTPAQLKKRLALARQYAGNARLGPQVQARMREIASAARTALAKAEGKSQPVKPPVAANPAKPPVASQPTVKPVEKVTQLPEKVPAGEPQQGVMKPLVNVDQLARKLLADRRPSGQLSASELKDRLAQSRMALASNRLSAANNAALRKMMQTDARDLRERQAAANAKKRQERAQRAGSNKSKTNISVNINLGAPAVVLRDRRPGLDLTTEELQHRIRVYRDIESSADYRSYRLDERDYWRRTLASDREILRRRLLDERHRRQAETTYDRDIIISVNPVPSVPVYEDVYVAEADDREIEDVLIAPPRERIVRRYTVDEIAAEPNLRRSIPRLELDTIHFGFGESIVREEEVGNLDSIGSVIERIIKRYPSEVFLIEGHTDAVGSDISNLYLSRARAEAVKQALVTYYEIPARNLRTTGLGERFLKIQTPEAEAENRRVSISRVTQYIGEAE